MLWSVSGLSNIRKNDFPSKGRLIAPFDAEMHEHIFHFYTFHYPSYFIIIPNIHCVIVVVDDDDISIAL